MQETRLTPGESLVELLRYYGFGADTRQADLLEQYIEMLAARRRWGGLASKGFAERWKTVLCETLAVAGAGDAVRGRSALDIGAGGGLLGIPLAIVRRDMDVCLVESLSRKAAFLAEASGKLRLENLTVRNARAESLAGERAFDLAVSRASGRLEALGPLALSLLKPKGTYVALKSALPEDEIGRAVGAIAKAGGRIVEVRPVDYPPGAKRGGGASLAVIEKL